MKALNLVMILSITFFAYMMALFFFGPIGTIAQHNLQTYKNTLLEHIQKLQRIHYSLTAEITDLRTNPQRIALEARKYGYYAPHEYIIRIPSYQYEKHFNIGQELSQHPTYNTPPSLLRTVAFSAGISSFLILIIINLCKNIQYAKQNKIRMPLRQTEKDTTNNQTELKKEKHTPNTESNLLQYSSLYNDDFIHKKNTSTLHTVTHDIVSSQNQKLQLLQNTIDTQTSLSHKTMPYHHKIILSPASIITAAQHIEKYK